MKATVEEPALVVLDPLSAKRLDKEIRQHVARITCGLLDLKELMEEAKAGEIHRALGYKSWPAYVADAVMFKDVRLPRPLRRELVCWLRTEGMSQRGIGDALGIPRNTVKSDLRAQVDQIDPPGSGAITDERRDAITTVTGLDNKQYQVPPSTGARGAQHLSELDKIAGRTAALYGNAIELHEAWTRGRDPGCWRRYDVDQIDCIREQLAQIQQLLAEMSAASPLAVVGASNTQ